MPHNRVLAVDALRGVAVLVWILACIVVPVLPVLPASSTREIVLQLSPSAWNGLTLYDVVLPAFLIAMGAGVVLSSKRLETHAPENRRWRMRVARRFVLLFLIGFLCEGELLSGWPDVRWVGVFQRLAVCYVVAVLLQRVSGWRVQAGLFAFLLLEYWAIMALVVVPGHPAGTYTMEGNVAAYVDQMLLPGRGYFGSWDPQGILTTFPAIAVIIAGMLLGEFLSSKRFDVANRMLWLVGAGIVALNAGYAWGYFFPINSHLWTSSFALMAIGVCAVVAGFLDFAANDRHFKRVAIPLVVLGGNSLVLVGLTQIFVWSASTTFFLPTGSLGFLWDGASPLRALIALAILGGFATWLYRRGICITV